MPKRTDIQSILIIGAGPIVIGQACEFDYSGVQACRVLREEGYRVILVNSNPATIMTDPQTADATYIEPITWETLERIIAKERPDAILPTMGGQTALNCAMDLVNEGILEKYGVELIGASPEAIEKAEDRERFKALMGEIGLECARSGVAHTLEGAAEVLESTGFPAVIRPSFTLGGTGGGIAYNMEEFVVPAVFAFSGGDPDTLQAGPALMFITIPKVFENMGLGTLVGVMFFILVLFAALTSSIALTESAVSTFEDELKWSRKKSTVLIGVIVIALGSLSSLGYGPLAGVTIIGMQFLDFFDFLTNSVMMPIAAIAICLLVSRVIGVNGIEEEVMHGENKFRRKAIFNFMIKYLCPIFAAIILASSVANAFGWISM